MGEKQGVREKIDRFTEHLIKVDRSLTPERAKQIATDAARRVEHGEKVKTEDKRGSKG